MDNTTTLKSGSFYRFAHGDVVGMRIYAKVVYLSEPILHTLSKYTGRCARRCKPMNRAIRTVVHPSAIDLLIGWVLSDDEGTYKNNLSIGVCADQAVPIGDVPPY
jgi:hypothetical protein